MESGFEALFFGVKSELRSPEDAVVGAVHWCIVTNGFKCIGKGENVPQNTQNISKSELLPSGWNSNSDVYSLLYVDDKNQAYLLKVVASEGALLVNFMKCQDERVGDTTLCVRDFCTGNLSAYENAYKNMPQLRRKMLHDVIRPMTVLTNSRNNDSCRPQARQSEDSSSSSRYTYPDSDDPLRVGQPGHYRAPPLCNPGQPFSIGRSDLDPLAGPTPGGGMFADPSRDGYPVGYPGGFRPGPGQGVPGQIPPGSVPPGARFDPIGPHGRGSRSGPDPDHMRPPDFDDDFYM